MGESPILLHILSDRPDEQDALDELTLALMAEVREQDIELVRPVESANGPDNAKGLSITAGWIAVQLSLRKLRSLVHALADWSARNGCEIEIKYGDDSIRVHRPTDVQQERLIGEWLDRHAQS